MNIYISSLKILVKQENWWIYWKNHTKYTDFNVVWTQDIGGNIELE